MESVRLQKKKYPDLKLSKKFEKDRLKNIKNKKELTDIENIIEQYHESDSIIKVTLGKENYTLDEIENFS